jgi:hypothetical protein
MSKYLENRRAQKLGIVTKETVKELAKPPKKKKKNEAKR